MTGGYGAPVMIQKWFEHNKSKHKFDDSIGALEHMVIVNSSEKITMGMFTPVVVTQYKRWFNLFTTKKIVLKAEDKDVRK